MFNRLHYYFSNGMLGIAELLITAFCVFFSLSFHEFAHGYAAYKLGDNTAKYMGRLSLSPFSHLDPIGAICLFLFGFGWAKPVPINPSNFKSGKYKSGMVITALAGPLANIILAFVSLLMFKIISAVYGNVSGIIGTVATIVLVLLRVLVSMNLSLAVFNIIPIPPLDGSKVLSAVLPSRIYFRLIEYERYGFIVLIILINTRLFSNIMYGITGLILKGFNVVLSLIPFL